MDEYEIGVGIPPMEGYYIDANFRCDVADDAILFFHKTYGTPSRLERTKIILSQSRMIEADIELKITRNPNIISFPRLKQCNIKKIEDDDENSEDVITLIFEQGIMSFGFKKAFYIKRIRLKQPAIPTGDVGLELARRLR